MKHLLLSLLIPAALLTASDALANRVYTYTDDEGTPLLGMLRRVSPNGRWAVGSDEEYETGSFIIDTHRPENARTNPDGELLDIDDKGMAVGSWYEKIGYSRYKRAAILRDGEWTRLPLPAAVIGRSECVAISADSRVICGHALCRSELPDEPGRYYPIVWTLNDATGEYELTRLYNNLYLPGTYGFFVYDMTPDGRYICGMQTLDFSDYIAVALNVETGELMRWHDIEIKDWYFDAVHSSFPTMFVDGVMDGGEDSGLFNERFIYATDRYLLGSHSHVSNVGDDGSGTVTTVSAVYDLEQGEWIDTDMAPSIMCGTGPDEFFTTEGEFVSSGASISIYNLIGTSDNVAGIYSFDDSGKVLTGSYIYYNPMGDLVESPVLVLLDEPCIMGGIEAIKDLGPAHRVTVNDRCIVVDGANTVAVYALDGTLLSRSEVTPVAAGIYIVRADNSSYKIIVR